MRISQPFFATAVLGFLFMAQSRSSPTSFENFEIAPKRVKRWGNNGWYGHGHGYGQAPNFVPYVPNNNVAVGYPTAYGLGMGYIRPGNGYGSENPNAPNPKSFPVRCINGGAHIGQCRLDDDAICMALGGTCVNSACCTTPFLGLLTTTTTTQAPLVIDGEAFLPKTSSIFSSREGSENENSKEEDSKRSTENSEASSDEIGEEKLKELSELSKLLELGRKAGLSTDSPIYAIFSGLLEHTTPAIPLGSTYPTVPPLSEWSRTTTESTTVTSTTTTTEAPRTEPTTTFRRTSKPPTTTDLPVNSIESRSVEDDIDFGPNDYTKKYCDSGMKPIGPCNDDGSCPIDHSCQRGQICCYDYALVMMNSIINKYKG